MKGYDKGRSCSSVAQLAGYPHGKREALSTSPDRATIFSSPVTFGGQCGGSRLGQQAPKGACLVVPSWFRAYSGTNLIKQEEDEKGRPCSSVAQLAEYSHGKREALGSSPGRATIFSFPVAGILERAHKNFIYQILISNVMLLIFSYQVYNFGLFCF